MPRNVVDGCLFCDPSPCTCNTRPKKTAPIKRTVPTTAAQPPVATSSPVAERSMRAVVTPQKRAGLQAVKRQPAIPRPVVVKPAPVVVKSVSDGEAELMRAVTVIADAGLLGEGEMRKHRKLIRLPDARIRAIVWRQRYDSRSKT